MTNISPVPMQLELNGQMNRSSSMAEAMRRYRDNNKATFKCHKRAKEKKKTTDFVLTDDKYLKFEEKTAEQWDKVVEYDMDEEDYAYLSLLNEKRAKNAAISDSSFELVMDRLEKECHFQAVKAGKGLVAAVDVDALCCVCQDGEGDNSNQIIFCDMCNIPVHQECYGVPYIPEGQWLCRRCQLSPSTAVQCALCPNTTGAFKQTSDGRWAHVLCAIWLNEVHFANTVFLEPIEGVEHAIKRRCRLRCIVCRAKVGACLQCSKKSCTRAFHVTCAQSVGLQMLNEPRCVLPLVSNEKGEKDEVNAVSRVVYCHLHANNQSLYPRDCSSTYDNKAAVAQKKRQMDEKVRRARKELAKRRNAPPTISVPVIPAERVASIGKAALKDGAAMRSLVSYWTLKRHSRCGVPLLRRLQVYYSKRAASRNRNEETTVRSPELRKFLDLRSDLERVRMLCELVHKRERYKRDFMVACGQLIDASCRPTAVIMQSLIDKLCNKDRAKIFHEPVSENHVPGYHSIIAKPMDLKTMRKKLSMGKYRRIADIRADFILMMDNCTKFNRGNAWFYKYGQRMRRIGVTQIKAAEREDSIVQNSQWLQNEASKFSLVDPSDLNAALCNMEEETATPSFASSQSIEPAPKRRKISTSVKKSGGLVQTAITNYLTPTRRPPQSAFASFRDPGNAMSPMGNISTTDASSAESNGEESSNEQVNVKTTRRRKAIKPVETVELCTWFVHDDIVWVTNDDGNYTVGRVVETSRRVFERQLPLDDVMRERPADSTNFTLVNLFSSSGKQWGWYANSQLSQFSDDDGHPGRERLPTDPVLRTAVQKANKYRKKTLNV